VVERLGAVPRAAHLAGLLLEVAPGHVEPDRVAEDFVERAFRRDLAAAFLERHHQLELVVHVLRARGVRERAVGGERIRRLGEEERRVAVRIVAHLAGVLGVVAPDAENPVHREQVGRVPDRQGYDPRRRDHVGQGRLLQGWTGQPRVPA
jgi:hypothetical protein